MSARRFASSSRRITKIRSGTASPYFMRPKLMDSGQAVKEFPGVEMTKGVDRKGRF